MHAHASLAHDTGMHKEYVFVLEDWEVLEIGEEGGHVVGTVPAGHVFVEGNTIWNADNPVLRQRWQLSRDGMMVVVMQVDNYIGLLYGTPEITCRGVIGPTDTAELEAKVGQAVDIFLETAYKDQDSWADTKAKLDQLVGDLVYKETGRRPMIVSVAQKAQ